MEAIIKTPGVYIQELDAFGNSIVPVPTGIPAFIGYTEKTQYQGNDLIQKPIKVSSWVEFQTIFGSEAPLTQFSLKESEDKDGKKRRTMARESTHYRLYSGLKLFFQNGGGSCYIVSVGTYDLSVKHLTDTEAFLTALTNLKKELESSLLVIPDVVEFDSGEAGLQEKYRDAYALQTAMINHCGELTSRFAILDIPGGNTAKEDMAAVITTFRNQVEGELSKFNSYAASYFPWLGTTAYQMSDVSCRNLSTASFESVIVMVEDEFNESGGIPASVSEALQVLETKKDDKEAFNKADSLLKSVSRSYKELMSVILNDLNVLAPSAAMAGIYAKVDNDRGVWKAPANVGIAGVVKPLVDINNSQQEDLNSPIDGKAICAIRSFPGRGVTVWGARTLDGNSMDYRYISVRRTLIFLEQSIKDAAMAYVFAPNDASTWAAVESIIVNFLTGIWKQGGLAGPKASDAFSVSVGLGKTMTGEDLLNGIMRVSVKVAISHPAEFIEISFQQEMQKG